MKKPTKEEMIAVNALVDKKIIKRATERGLPVTFILSTYHKTGRKGKRFSIALNQALDEKQVALDRIDDAINLTRQQLKNYDEMKQSLVFTRTSGLLDEDEGDI